MGVQAGVNAWAQVGLKGCVIVGAKVVVKAWVKVVVNVGVKAVAKWWAKVGVEVGVKLGGEGLMMVVVGRCWLLLADDGWLMVAG